MMKFATLSGALALLLNCLAPQACAQDSQLVVLKRDKLIVGNCSTSPPLALAAEPPLTYPRAMLAMAGMVKSFGANQVLRGISLSVAAGEAVVVIGPSGCGNTTLLRCINMLEDYQQGTVTGTASLSAIAPIRAPGNASACRNARLPSREST